MSPLLYRWVGDARYTHIPKKLGKVCEIGSKDYNGSVKDHFSEAEQYVGIDMEEGTGVDLVGLATEVLTEEYTDTFDAVICCECLEHDPKFWETLKTIKRVLKVGGHLILSVPTYGFGYHGYPKDYYRFTEDTFNEVFFEGYEKLSLSKLQHADGCPGIAGIAKLCEK